MPESPQVTAQLAQRVLDVVDKGLTHGLGQRSPGHMCVEAAVCYALGLPHGDYPSCVGGAVRSYKIGINDAQWSSDSARAAGLRRVAVAQLGSDGIDQVDFAQRMAVRTVNSLLADTLDLVGIDSAVCRAATTVDAAHAAAHATAYATATATAADAAADAARAAAAATAAHATATATATAAAYAAHAAHAAYAAHAAAAAYAAARAAAAAAGDKVLCAAAEMAVQVLIEMDCPGTRFLYLTEAP